ncbi:hypothetical protein BU23DRAFT_481479, partial [Bimuria novae-zelandiae CBS 107.79]
HPRYTEIIQLVDMAVSRLLLRPSAPDASLYSIQSLLLYFQWMPYDLYSPNSSTTHTQIEFKTRYNEMSTWFVFGIALRYASFFGLEQKALSTFGDEFGAVHATKEDLENMRVWLNIVTYDCNLTLTSGMPASLRAEPTNTAAYKFCSHHAAQRPGDLRYASMVSWLTLSRI